MQPHDAKAFKALLQGVHSFYGKDLSEFALGVWWEAMRPFDFDAVRDALNRHAVNPDNGQFLPKPADVVKLLQGSTLDSAMVAWAKVDRAMRTVGPYASVVFDDPIVHRVLHDMGGWIALSRGTEDEWPFKAKEFENRYRGLKTRTLDAYPPQLTGIEEAENAKALRTAKPRVVMIGDRSRCEAVAAGGSTHQLLTMHQATPEQVLRIARQ